jgi:hypothetical protein
MKEREEKEIENTEKVKETENVEKKIPDEEEKIETPVGVQKNFYKLRKRERKEKRKKIFSKIEFI